MAQPTALDLLELDLDARLLWVWLEAWPIDDWDESRVAPFLRCAYFTGYRDALTEARRGSLFRAHGQRVPTRQQPEASR
jgi:hypothetical protein